MDNNTNCTLFDQDQHKCDVVIALKRTTGALSLVGCSFMIIIIWLFRKYNVLSQRLILYLSIAALCDTIGYIMSDMLSDGVQCDFVGWWMTYFPWTVLLWVSCLTFNLFMNVVKQRRTEQYEKYFHLVCWGFPLFLSVLPLFGDNYGPAGAWCWIKHTSTAWRFAIWYVPLFIAIVGLFVTYTYIIYFLKKRLSSWQGNYDPDTERHNSNIKEDIKVLKAYPFVYLVLSIFPLILRIHNAVTVEGDDVYALWILTVLTAPLMGAVNAIVFGLDPDTRSKLTWTHIQLAWSSRRSTSAIREYPEYPTRNVEVYNITDDAVVVSENPDVGRTSSIERHYNSLTSPVQ